MVVAREWGVGGVVTQGDHPEGTALWPVYCPSLPYCLVGAVKLNEAKCSRPRLNLPGRGHNFGIEAKASVASQRPPGLNISARGKLHLPSPLRI